MLFGNAGGVAVILCIPPLHPDGASYAPVVMGLAALVGVAVALAAKSPETFPAAAPSTAPATGRER